MSKYNTELQELKKYRTDTPEMHFYDANILHPSTVEIAIRALEKFDDTIPYLYDCPVCLEHPTFQEKLPNEWGRVEMGISCKCSNNRTRCQINMEDCASIDGKKYFRDRLYKIWNRYVEEVYDAEKKRIDRK